MIAFPKAIQPQLAPRLAISEKGKIIVDRLVNYAILFCSESRLTGNRKMNEVLNVMLDWLSENYRQPAPSSIESNETGKRLSIGDDYGPDLKANS